MPKVKMVMVRWVHSMGFRHGEWAKISGVRMVYPSGLPARLCFYIEYEDGMTDLMPILDSDNYEIREL